MHHKGISRKIKDMPDRKTVKYPHCEVCRCTAQHCEKIRNSHSFSNIIYLKSIYPTILPTDSFSRNFRQNAERVKSRNFPHCGGIYEPFLKSSSCMGRSMPNCGNVAAKEMHACTILAHRENSISK